MVYIGVDLHSKVSQVPAVQANGQVLWNRRIRSRPEEFAELVGDLPTAPAGVAFEGTGAELSRKIKEPVPEGAGFPLSSDRNHEPTTRPALRSKRC
jgi:hypothetical protein